MGLTGSIISNCVIAHKKQRTELFSSVRCLYLVYNNNFSFTVRCIAFAIFPFFREIIGRCTFSRYVTAFLYSIHFRKASFDFTQMFSQNHLFGRHYLRVINYRNRFNLTILSKSISLDVLSDADTF